MQSEEEGWHRELGLRSGKYIVLSVKNRWGEE